MGRKVSGAAGVGGVTDLKTLRVNQANGYANVGGYGQSNWHSMDVFWSGQYGSSNNSITLESATSYIKLTTQVNVDHGDTWRSGMLGYAVYTTRNSSSGGTYWLGNCAATNYISNHSTTGANGFSKRFFKPSDHISGLQDGATVYFAFYFRRQDGGGWNYINNLHTNTESASNGDCAKAGIKMDLEEVPNDDGGFDWDPS